MIKQYLKISHWCSTNAIVLNISKGNIRAHEVCCKTNHNRIFHFADAQNITNLLHLLESSLNKQAQKISTQMDVAEILAHFWFFFLAIHPFADGNRRTAENIISQILMELGWHEFDFTLLRKFLFTSFEKDRKTLTHIFLHGLRMAA